MKKTAAALLLLAVLLLSVCGSASADVIFTKESAGPSGCIFVAGNPDLYPFESYNSRSGEYEGVMPEVLREISGLTGLNFAYVSAGTENRQKQLGENRQAEILTAYDGETGDWCISRETVFQYELDGKVYDVSLCFTDIIGGDDLQKITDAVYDIPADRINGFVTGASAEKQSRFLHDDRTLFVSIGVLVLAAAVFICSLVKEKNAFRRREVEKWTDSLTGIGNRAYFIGRYDSLVNENNRSFLHLAYYRFDTDWVNRCIGPDKADQLITRIAGSFPEESADSITARVSGGAIASLFESGSEDTAMKSVRDCLERVNGYAREITGKQGVRVYAALLPLKYVSCSGESALKYVSETVERSGMPSVSLCDDDVIRESTENEKLLADIASSIEKDEFEIYVQPIYSIEKGAFCGGEVLCRWNTKRYGLLKPSRFMELVEDKNLAEIFDYRIFSKACGCLQTWADAGHPELCISCNFSRSTMSKPGFISRIREEASKYSFPRENLMIEITEAVLEEDAAQLSESVKGIRELGYKIALDDFGIGYTTFMNLYSFAPDYIKLGREFIENTGNPQGNLIFTELTGFVHRLGMKLICEGVENAEEDSFAKRCGCDYIQGYYYSHAMPPAEAIKKIVSGAE